MITREPILAALQAQLEPLAHIQAMWQGGAAAFGRVDEWSDIDIQFAADDERVEEVFGQIEAALESVSPIELRYRMPSPTWHGHEQAVYRLEGTSPYLFLDVVVMQASAKEKFLASETHGEVVVAFDKTGVVVPPPFDAADQRQKLIERVEVLKLHFELFRVLTTKELHRENDFEAYIFYQNFTLKPLIELLRIIHSPGRHGFHLRYLQHDCPPAVVRRLRPLLFVAHLEDIREKREQAEGWFWELIEGPDLPV